MSCFNSQKGVNFNIKNLRKINGLDKSETNTVEKLGINVGKLISQKSSNVHKTNRQYTQIFYALILLRYFTKPTSIFGLEQASGISRGDIEKLHTAACGYGSSLSKFCNEIPAFKPLAVLIDSFLPQFQLMCFQNTEILPLLDLPHMRLSRAKLFFAAGFTEIKIVANADPNNIVKSIEKISRKQAGDIVQAAKLIIKETLNSLVEEVDILMAGCNV